MEIHNCRFGICFIYTQRVPPNHKDCADNRSRKATESPPITITEMMAERNTQKNKKALHTDKNGT